MTEQTTIFNPLPVCNSIRRSSAWASLARSLSAALDTHKKKVCRLIKFCALNGQIILIINLLPKQLAINYNLMMNYLLLTAWGKRRNQTLIIHWVIKFIGASAPPTPPTPTVSLAPLERGGTGRCPEFRSNYWNSKWNHEGALCCCFCFLINSRYVIVGLFSIILQSEFSKQKMHPPHLHPHPIPPTLPVSLCAQ